MRHPAAVARRAEKPRTFLSVAEVAHLTGLGQMTIYRAIQAGDFPAIRVQKRLLIPARAIEEMVELALAEGRLVDPADWVRAEARIPDGA